MVFYRIVYNYISSQNALLQCRSIYLYPLSTVLLGLYNDTAAFNLSLSFYYRTYQLLSHFHFSVTQVFAPLANPWRKLI